MLKMAKCPYLQKQLHNDAGTKIRNFSSIIVGGFFFNFLIILLTRDQSWLKVSEACAKMTPFD